LKEPPFGGSVLYTSYFKLPSAAYESSACKLGHRQTNEYWGIFKPIHAA